MRVRPNKFRKKGRRDKRSVIRIRVSKFTKIHFSNKNGAIKRRGKSRNNSAISISFLIRLRTRKKDNHEIIIFVKRNTRNQEFMDAVKATYTIIEKNSQKN